MKIEFQTKEESNKKQQEEFLRLSKVERLYSFFRLMERMRDFPIKNKIDRHKDNFLIIISQK
jgi:hypothetical protein